MLIRDTSRYYYWYCVDRIGDVEGPLKRRLWNHHYWKLICIIVLISVFSDIGLLMWLTLTYCWLSSDRAIDPGDRWWYCYSLCDDPFDGNHLLIMILLFIPCYLLCDIVIPHLLEDVVDWHWCRASIFVVVLLMFISFSPSTSHLLSPWCSLWCSLVSFVVHSSFVVDRSSFVHVWPHSFIRLKCCLQFYVDVKLVLLLLTSDRCWEEFIPIIIVGKFDGIDDDWCWCWW